MTPEVISPSRLTSRLLRAVLDRDRASAVLGDLSEDCARRLSEQRPLRWPRLWIESRALGYVLAAVWSGVPPSLRAFRYAVRDAARSLRSAPGTTAFILLILTLGIAAATVTFSVVDTVVLRQLPFEHSEDLVVVSAGKNVESAAAQEFLAWRDHTDAFADLAAVRAGSESLRFGSSTEDVRSVMTTASLFDVLRVHPLVGHTFDTSNETDGRDGVAVISFGLWQRRFGGDRGVVGTTLQLHDRAVVIVGVMPRGFTYPIAGDRPVDLWTPYVVPEDERSVDSKGISRYLQVVGRRRPGVSDQQALAMMSAALQPFVEAQTKVTREWDPRIWPLYDSLVGNVRGWMLLVLWAVGLVMLVASVNVANLLLTRSTARARQLAIRASLGASRRQLVAALVVESLLLSLSATALGVLIATWGIGAAKAALPAGIARAAGIALDLRVLLAAAVTAVATGLVFGAVPAWQASRTDVVSLLKDTSTTVAGGRRTWRSVFLVLEVAFVGILLVATTMIVSSFVRITRAELGFERSHLISVSAFGYRGNVDDLADPLRSLPGVVSVAVVAAGSPPLIAAGFGGGSSTTTLQRSDAPEGTEPLMAEMRRVSPEYFQTAGMPFMKGQSFGDAEAGMPRAIVIDDVAARALFGDQNPVGATLRGRGPQDVFTVTGVVSHVRLNGPERASGPQAYYALAPRSGSPQLLLRTSAPPAAMLPAVQATLARALPSGTPPAEVHALEDAFRRITADRRFNAGLMSIFGALALFIGAAGIYGVMASVVAQQTREIGVRVALGASAARIRRDVVAQAGRYLGAGLGLGLPAAWWASRMFTSLLFDVRPTDPAVYAIVAALLAGVGVLAALVPARRAARVDPLIALKS